MKPGCQVAIDFHCCTGALGALAWDVWQVWHQWTQGCVDAEPGECFHAHNASMKFMEGLQDLVTELGGNSHSVTQEEAALVG